MKIKRYQARDMRSALQQVRLEQGPDAIILSTQSVDGGVEVCAADDADHSQLARSHRQGGAQALAAVTASAILATPTGSSQSEVPAKPLAPIAPLAAAMSADAAQTAMSADLRSLRDLLEGQLAALSWNDFTRRDPIRARALNELMDLGLPRDQAWPLLENLPNELLADAAGHAHYDALAQALRTTRLEPLLNGAVALIGPPGAGKSTVLTKLAVRAVVEHGAAQIAILTLDTERLAAGDQARAIGRLLGVDTVAFESGIDLAALRSRWSNKKLVLIDTAGAAPREAIALQLLSNQLAAFGVTRSLLVLPASAQPELLECCITEFGRLAPEAAVLTRVDEALSLGGSLAALLRHALPLAAIADGPRVPEDLRPARAAELVSRAVALKAENHGIQGMEHAAA